MPFFLLFFSLQLLAGVIQDDVSTTEKARFSFKTVCLKVLGQDAPLIDVLSGTEINCMGKKLDVALFCDKQMAQDPYYLRAYVDEVSREVVCHSGKKVLFKFQCVKLIDHKLCDSDAKISCGQMKQKLAKRLDIVHSSVTKNAKGIKELNCYFEALPLNENLIGP
jgi:hypothetical protein